MHRTVYWVYFCAPRLWTLLFYLFLPYFTDLWIINFLNATFVAWQQWGNGYNCLICYNCHAVPCLPVVWLIALEIHLVLEVHTAKCQSLSGDCAVQMKLITGLLPVKCAFSIPRLCAPNALRMEVPGVLSDLLNLPPWPISLMALQENAAKEKSRFYRAKKHKHPSGRGKSQSDKWTCVSSSIYSTPTSFQLSPPVENNYSLLGQWDKNIIWVFYQTSEDGVYIEMSKFWIHFFLSCTSKK